jgi:hypothetical protein
MKIEIKDDQYYLLLRAVGNEKARLNQGGFFTSAHLVSDLLATLKNNVEREVTTNGSRTIR